MIGKLKIAKAKIAKMFGLTEAEPGVRNRITPYIDKRIAKQPMPDVGVMRHQRRS
jgi:hypothetical protein